MTNSSIWNAINAFKLDQPESTLSFSKRLARENNWTEAYTKQVVLEYKKFIYLCTISDQPVTPSDAVDQAWHLHLLYTRSYWEDLCRNTLKKNIHHGPSKGGLEERNKFKSFYSFTFQKYKEEFGAEPPAEIWLESKKRFSEFDFKRVNSHTHWVVKKPRKSLLSLLGIVTAIGIGFSIQASKSKAPIVSFVVIAALIYILFNITGGKNSGGSGDCASTCGTDSDSDSGCSSCSGCSGCGGCGD